MNLLPHTVVELLVWPPIFAQLDIKNKAIKLHFCVMRHHFYTLDGTCIIHSWKTASLWCLSLSITRGGWCQEFTASCWGCVIQFLCNNTLNSQSRWNAFKWAALGWALKPLGGVKTAESAAHSVTVQSQTMEGGQEWAPSVAQLRN